MKELHKRSGVRYNTVIAYYYDYVIRINKADLYKMCDALGCKLSELMEYIPDKK